MSYVRHILQPGEQVIRIGRRHWIIYREAIVLGVLALLIFAYGYLKFPDSWYPDIAAAVMLAGALVFFVRAWFLQAITEIAVTNKRVIYKIGFISRHTQEMNIDKVETVVVDQSVFGRLLNYGTVHIRGMGQGIENLREIAAPIDLRNAIETR